MTIGNVYKQMEFCVLRPLVQSFTKRNLLNPRVITSAALEENFLSWEQTLNERVEMVNGNDCSVKLKLTEKNKWQALVQKRYQDRRKSEKTKSLCSFKEVVTWLVSALCLCESSAHGKKWYVKYKSYYNMYWKRRSLQKQQTEK